MEFLEVPLFDDDIFKLVVRFAINLVVVLAIVKLCYGKNQKDATYPFTFLLLNVMVFFICFALKKLDLGLGMALGLFAIFAIMRYRTDSIRVKEMTYLFVVVGVAVINALSNKKTSYAELALTNAIVIGTAYLLERYYVVKTKLPKQSIVFDNLALLHPDKRSELFEDLANRTGLVAERVTISKIDLQKANATIVVHYRESSEDGDVKDVGSAVGDSERGGSEEDSDVSGGAGSN